MSDLPKSHVWYIRWADHLVLPYPPTVNTYWRMSTAGGRLRMHISPKGLAYRQKVKDALLEASGGRMRMWDGDLSFRLWVSPPDKRVRDLDNLLKALLDALGEAHAYDNDSRIRRLDIMWCHPVKGGRVVLESLEETGDESGFFKEGWDDCG